MATTMVAGTAPTSSPTCPLYLDANSPVVASLTFINWSPAPTAAGAASQLQIDSPTAVRVFIPRCKISRLPADQVACRQRNPMTAALSEAAWTRLLTEYHASSAFVRVHLNLQQWEETLRTLTPVTPANLEIAAGDWRAVPAVTIPSGQNAAAGAARAAAYEVHFLRLASPVFLRRPRLQYPPPLLCHAGECLRRMPHSYRSSR